MKNFAIAGIFSEIADAYDIKGVEWKPRAYRRAARKIENYTGDIEAAYREGRLEEIPGLGESMRNKIEEYIKTGKIKKREELLKDVPKELVRIKNIPGLGPKKTRKLHEELGIKNIRELKKAAREHKIRELDGFGGKNEEEILNGIKELESGEGRFLLNLALASGEEMLNKLKRGGNFRKAVLAGSLRRMRPAIGDIDILAVVNDSKKAVEAFIGLPDIEKVSKKGETRSSARLDSGINVDLRIIEARSWGSALQYFTGSKAHNIKLRNMAAEKGWKLSEYGLFKGKKCLAARTEEGIYKKLGCKYIEPELREDNGELEAAGKDRLPRLVEAEDILGDLHVHTEWSDGDASIKEMIKAAKDRDYGYICISDHSASRAIAGGLSEKRLEKQIKEVKEADKGISGIKALIGAEVDILGDGSLDFGAEVLEKLDFVIASIHSGFKMNEKKMTDRIIKAIKDKRVNAIGHPTGRMINKRSGYDVDLKEVIKEAAKNRVALEINAAPERLDLEDIWIREAVKQGAKLVINTDAHTIGSLDNMRFGLAQARRGWAEKNDIINTWKIKNLLSWLKKK